MKLYAGYKKAVEALPDGHFAFCLRINTGKCLNKAYMSYQGGLKRPLNEHTAYYLAECSRAIIIPFEAKKIGSPISITLARMQEFFSEVD